ncbi:MAG: NAD(P)H-binding protein [bacterium]
MLLVHNRHIPCGEQLRADNNFSLERILLEMRGRAGKVLIMILLTGVTGHTGCRLADHLAARGGRVRAMTRSPGKIPAGLRGRIEVFQGDLENAGQAADAARGCSAVLALTHIRFAPLVIGAAQTAGVSRAVFMSSTRRYTKYPEATARQVMAGEEAVRSSGLEWTIIRPSMIYGGRQDNNIEHLVRSLRRFPVHPLPGGGRMLWQPVFVWDVVAAIEAALDDPASIRNEYTIAGPQPISYACMVRTILRVMNRRVLLVPIPMAGLKSVAWLSGWISGRPRITMEQIRRLEEDKVFDISPAAHDLHFQPTPFEAGIRRKLADDV